MITIKIGGSVVNDLHPSVVADIKKVVEQEEVIPSSWWWKGGYQSNGAVRQGAKVCCFPWRCKE